MYIVHLNIHATKYPNQKKLQNPQTISQLSKRVFQYENEMQIKIISIECLALTQRFRSTQEWTID